MGPEYVNVIFFADEALLIAENNERPTKIIIIIA